jgi:hypothetical protein
LKNWCDQTPPKASSFGYAVGKAASFAGCAHFSAIDPAKTPIQQLGGRQESAFFFVPVTASSVTFLLSGLLSYAAWTTRFWLYFFR